MLIVTSFARRGNAGPGVDGNQPDTTLNEAASKQQILSQRVPAVTIAHARVFTFQVERLPRLGTGHEVERALLQASHLNAALGMPHLARTRLERGQQFAAVDHLLDGESRGGLEDLGPEFRC